MCDCTFCDSDYGELATENLMRDKEINLGIIQSINLNVTIQDRDELCLYIMDENANVLQEFTSKIQYCPICGRKLVNNV